MHEKCVLYSQLLVYLYSYSHQKHEQCAELCRSFFIGSHTNGFKRARKQLENPLFKIT